MLSHLKSLLKRPVTHVTPVTPTRPPGRLEFLPETQEPHHMFSFPEPDTYGTFLTEVPKPPVKNASTEVDSLMEALSTALKKLEDTRQELAYTRGQLAEIENDTQAFKGKMQIRFSKVEATYAKNRQILCAEIHEQNDQIHELKVLIQSLQEDNHALLNQIKEVNKAFEDYIKRVQDSSKV